MHALQPKQTKVKDEDVEKLLKKYNIALAQLPKVSKKDAGLPEDSKTGDVVKIERKGDIAETYYRIVI
jgi:DNA-directed RNA polymerase subunit H (RpoH/RPB5)|tara:strand:+ start:278 stop:481 length:204 start_codon:yes stop_codon:yes gene_type:complete